MTGVVSIQEAPTTGVGKLISENFFFVPTHQRDYRWGQEKVKQLFDDLSDAMVRDDHFYFIGLMVFMQENGTLRVLDGQQRLATTIILLSAIRSWFAANRPSTDSTATQIQSQFIGYADFGETVPRPKLTLNFNNGDKFKKHVIGATAIAEIRKERAALSKHAPNADLLSAIIYCHERIASIAEKDADTDKTAKYLIDFLKFVRERVIVVRLTVPNEVNAFRVFETLNDRGLDLSAVDLLKNYLFGLARDKSATALHEIEMRWVQITRTIAEFKQDDFIKVFWTSRRGRTQLDAIYDDVKSQYKTGDAAGDLSIEMLEAAEKFAALEVPDDPVWSPHSQKTRSTVASLAILGAKQTRPVVLAALMKFAPDQLEKLLWLLEVVIVRYQLIGEERTGALEITCAKLAPMIFSGTITTAKEATTTLKDIYPSDKEFQEAFRKKEDVTNQKAQYILRRMEDYERQLKAPGAASVASPNLTVEHILPRNPSNSWNAEIQDDADLVAECALRLGNLCLLTEKTGKSLGNGPFSEKVKVYAQSDLRTTQQLATLTSWNRKMIDHRQAWMAAKAAAIWRFS